MDECHRRVRTVTRRSDLLLGRRGVRDESWLDGVIVVDETCQCPRARLALQCGLSTWMKYAYDILQNGRNLPSPNLLVFIFLHNKFSQLSLRNAGAIQLIMLVLHLLLTRFSSLNLHCINKSMIKYFQKID